ncbi:MAG: HNH endonuclease, partial [Rhodothermaceae bacterium]|nr:HNH endonuclease [Rhodothermaceae bacterium]
TSMYRLGNLTLLESSANKKISNTTFDEKCEAYKKSTYALTKEIPEIAPEEWTPALVNKRQQQLARRAVHLWRSDFA